MYLLTIIGKISGNFENEIGDILVLGTILSNVLIKNAYINKGQPSSKLEAFKVPRCR
jgi:hypothetical protein